MTRFLFIDNFRGFVDTYVPIRDVNFLVGQNSTGKTSVLGLLKLLSAQRIFWGRDFGDVDVNFGHFKDMVSAHSADRSYFRIGAIVEHAFQGLPRGAAMLFTYKEDEGLPRLAQVTATVGLRQASLRFIDKQILCKLKDIPSDTTPESLRDNLFPGWVKEHSGDPVGYKTLSLPKGYYVDDRYHLWAALSFAQESESKARRIPVAFPSLPELVWIAPIRTKPKRTYDEFQIEFAPEGSHTPYLIRRILQSKSKDSERFRAFIEEVGKNSGLFQSIRIRRHGRGVTAPFEVDAVVDDKALNLFTVGYGVSQSLPVFVELLTRPPDSWFAIQQPEVHLHPRAQAALGDVFFEMATSEDKRFLIETHSDFTIDRFRMNYRKTTKPSRVSSQILFFERSRKHNTVTPIDIGADGELSGQPDSYRRFFVKEEMDLLGL